MPSHPPQPRSSQDEEPLLRIIARRTVCRAKGKAWSPHFSRMLFFQGTGAAGDALVALALAGSLFFSVPETEARGRVFLYLALTVAPFAVIAPFLSAFLDRFHSSLRWATVIAASGRALLAWLLATRLHSLYLFPIAFGVLVLSRAALVVKGALLPQLVPEGKTLVAANSSVSRVNAVAGLAIGLPGLGLIYWPGVHVELLFAALVYVAGVVPALRLPSGRGRRAEHERMNARTAIRSISVRQAVVATAGLRLLVGFLVFHLAFALRRADLGTLGLGFLVGSAALGGLAGAVLAPRLRRLLREEGIVAGGLFIAGVAGILAGYWFSLTTAAALVFAFGIAAGAVKLAFDSIVQREVPEGARGWAFARFESVMQLAWVAGGLVPLAIPLPGGGGVMGAGVLASLLALIFVAGRRKARTARAS